MSTATQFSQDSEYLLMTGCTGLLGRYLLKDLLEAGIPLAVLVRPTRRQSAADRVESIVATWERQLGQQLPRPVVLEGNLSEESLGLSSDSEDWVRSNCYGVLHNAASLSFVSGPRDAEPWKTNLTGTELLLNLCRDTGIREFHHVSTAYVCGARQGTIYEQELDEGQALSNDYEWSKLEAEKLLREADFLDTKTIYRPSIIVGDSETGFTTTFHGFYAALQLSHVISKGIAQMTEGEEKPKFRVNLDGNENKNLVPVDWVSAFISHAIPKQHLHNQTYHLTPQNPVTAETIMNVLTAIHNSQDLVQLVGAETRIENPNEIERMFYENMQVYSSYWKNDPNFDTSNTRQAAPHLPCPMMDEDRMMMLAKAAVDMDFRWRDLPVRTEAGITG
ncbi:MAG: SDR family oxidoreductase [Planctomycetaceae bacterium]|nr:SDR family oxidoreductase [Planctomycetaceae bacterium]